MTKHYNDLDRRKEALAHHDNLGSPHTQSSVMTGAAYGAADYATGAAIGKGVSAISKAYKSTTTTNVYRVFGGDAKPIGRFWTPDDPSTIANFREAAGLLLGEASGSTNTGQFVIEGTVKNKDIIKKTTAAPLDGNAGGGIREYQIDPKNVNIDRVSGANPQF